MILVLSLGVLVICVRLGYDHTFGFGGKFDSSSLRIPLDWIGWDTIKVKLRYMYLSLLVCMVLLTSVNIELILRCLLSLAGRGVSLPPDDAPQTV